MAYGPGDSVTIPLGIEPTGDGDFDGDDQVGIEDVIGDICPGCGEEPTGRGDQTS